MSTFVDQWVQNAMVDDTIVVEQLLRLKHHQPLLHTLLTPWPARKCRSPRLPVQTARPDRTSPTTSLSWTTRPTPTPTPTLAINPEGSKAVCQSETTIAKTSTKKRAVDQSETSNATRSKKIKTVDKGETSVAKTASNKTLIELKRDVKLKQTERKGLKDEVAAMKLTFEKAKASNDKLKIKLDKIMSRRPMESVQPFLEPPEFVVPHYDQSSLVSAQAVQDETLEDETLVCAASASAPSNQQDINGQKPLPLPDLNVPPYEYFTDFILH